MLPKISMLRSNFKENRSVFQKNDPKSCPIYSESYFKELVELFFLAIVLYYFGICA